LAGLLGQVMPVALQAQEHLGGDVGGVLSSAGSAVANQESVRGVALRQESSWELCVAVQGARTG
jgi:hypothetical protein